MHDLLYSAVMNTARRKTEEGRQGGEIVCIKLPLKLFNRGRWKNTLDMAPWAAGYNYRGQVQLNTINLKADSLRDNTLALIALFYSGFI